MAQTEEQLRDRVAKDASDVAAWTSLAEMAMRRGDLDDALWSLAAATRLAPGDATLQNHLAFALLEAGRPADAQAAAERALRISPRHPAAYLHLGRALGEQGRAEAALDPLRAAVRLDPALAPAHYGLGSALAHLGQWTAAAMHFEEARRLLPEAFEAWVGRANCELHAGRRRAAVETLREAARVIPSAAPELESHALFAMQYGDEYRAEEVFDAHRAWARDHASHAVPPPTHTAKSGKVRVGFVAPSFRASAMGFALLPLLRAHDRARFEFVAYSNGDFEDEAAQQARDACDGWRITPDLDDVAFAQAVHADGIDVLVDLAGHTPGNRLRAFALKPARVQVSWLDYFNTTGLESMDALIADDTTLATPLQQSFTERLVSAGPVRYPYAAPSYAPAPTARSHPGPAVFGSFARLAKVCPTTMEAWCAVLRAVPGSRLLLKNDSLGDPPLRDEVLASFETRGIDGARIELRPLSGHQAMLAQYADIDVVLDTLPYNGGITTLEALWMGRPVVTVAGATLLARQGASLLAAAGQAQWVARDVEQFAAIAASLVADRAALARLHAGLRDKVKGSPLCDGVAFARRFESLLSDLLGRP